MFRRCKRLSELDVRVAQEQEAMCKALYELAYARTQEDKINPRPMPQPYGGLDYPVGNGFYKQRLKRLLK